MGRLLVTTGGTHSYDTGTYGGDAHVSSDGNAHVFSEAVDKSVTTTGAGTGTHGGVASTSFGGVGESVAAAHADDQAAAVGNHLDSKIIGSCSCRGRKLST
jgi:hypothetical protein